MVWTLIWFLEGATLGGAAVQAFWQPQYASKSCYEGSFVNGPKRLTSRLTFRGGRYASLRRTRK